MKTATTIMSDSKSATVSLIAPLQHMLLSKLVTSEDEERSLKEIAISEDLNKGKTSHVILH